MSTPAGYTSYHDGPTHTAIPLGNDAPPQGYVQAHNNNNNEPREREYNDLRDVNALIGAMCAAICVSGFLVSLFFVVLEPHNRYIRFHSYQTMLVNVVFFLVFLILIIGMMADVARGWIISLYVFLILQLIVGVVLAAHAYRGARSGFMNKLPIVGDAALKFAVNAAAPANLDAKVQLL
jgi:uncharacterized membrane protein